MDLPEPRPNWRWEDEREGLVEVMAAAPTKVHGEQVGDPRWLLRTPERHSQVLQVSQRVYPIVCRSSRQRWLSITGLALVIQPRFSLARSQASASGKRPVFTGAKAADRFARGTWRVVFSLMRDIYVTSKPPSYHSLFHHSPSIRLQGIMSSTPDSLGIALNPAT